MNGRKSQFRQKRTDTKLSSIEKQYGRDFGTRSDKNLPSYLEKLGYPALSQLLAGRDDKPQK